LVGNFGGCPELLKTDNNTQIVGKMFFTGGITVGTLTNNNLKHTFKNDFLLATAYQQTFATGVTRVATDKCDALHKDIAADATYDFES